eukprot:112514_1
MRQSFLVLLLSCLVQNALCVELYVSSQIGSDNNDGSLTKPFKTISKSLDVTRNVRKSNINNTANIYVSSGEYQPFSLEVEDKNIAFHGENGTKISGGYHVTTNWTKQNENDNIWSTSIKLPSNYSMNNNTMNFPKQFWINNKRRNKIETDVLYWDNILDPNDTNNDINSWGLVYKKGDIDKSWNLMAPGVIVFVFHQWTVSLHQVSYHNFNNQTIIFAQPSDVPIGKLVKASQKRYYIQGIPQMDLLSQSGSWSAMFDDIDNPTNIIVNYAPLKNEIFPNNMIYIEHPFEYKPLISLIGKN